MIKICQMLNSYEIEYITFKGVVLAHALYNNVYERYFRDIDLYVDENYFDKSYKLLLNAGYKLYITNNSSMEHHIILTNKKVVVELHRKIFNPYLNIDETYFKKNISTQQLFGNKIVTFNTTSTLLHLLYH